MGSPFHIWLRIKVTNSGKSVAKDVYAKLLSFKADGTMIYPFNPFRLRWTSSGYSHGDLINGEPEYLNLATIIGNDVVTPTNRLVEGIPIGDPNNSTGQSGVAGMDLSLYDLALHSRFEFHVILGGVNIKTSEYIFIVDIKLCQTPPKTANSNFKLEDIQKCLEFSITKLEPAFAL